MSPVDPRADLDLLLGALDARRFTLTLWPHAGGGWNARIDRRDLTQPVKLELGLAPIHGGGETSRAAALDAWAAWGKAARGPE